jgi:hypothetical protein
MLVLGLQGSSWRRRFVLSAAFRGWQEEVQLQQYRRHVVVILSHKVNNGLLLKAFNCWRCACSVHPQLALVSILLDVHISATCAAC